PWVIRLAKAKSPAPQYRGCPTGVPGPASKSDTRVAFDALICDACVAFENRSTLRQKRPTGRICGSTEEWIVRPNTKRGFANARVSDRAPAPVHKWRHNAV